MKKILFLSCLLFGILLGTFADRVEKMPVTLTQPTGETLNVFVTGDEYFHYYHDRHGFTIMPDENGVYRYAIEVDGKLEPSAYIAGQVDPLTTGLKPFATISQEEYKRRIDEFHGFDALTYKSLLLDEDIELFQTGDFNNVVIIIRFTDSPEFVGEDKLHTLFNADNVRSVKEYYKKVSYNKLNMISHFLPRSTNGDIITFDAPNDYNYYNQSNVTRNELFAAALAYADANSSGFSANVDKDNNGRIDNVSFVLNHARKTSWGTPLWPHKSYYGSGNLLGKRTGTYYLAYTGDGFKTHVHEMFHVLSAPDLYHYTGNGISPAGPWDLMQSGGGHMMAYMKERYGKWIPSISQLDQSGSYYMKSVGKSEVNSAYYLKPNKTKDELFYFEYRNKSDDIFESSLPGSGIIFYRINPKLRGNAQGPPDMLYIFRPNGSDLVNGAVNQAHFSAQTGRTVFDPGTNPNPFFEDGSVAEFRVHSIGNSGNDSILFSLDFDHIENFRVTNVANTAISLEWDKEDSVIMVCSRNPINGSPKKGVAYKPGDVISDGSQVIYVGSDNGFTHSGLKSGTFYYYKIWIIDTKYDSYIGSAATAGFTNYKPVVDEYPFYTGFEQDTLGTVPAYWAQGNLGNYGSWSVNAEKSKAGKHGLKFSTIVDPIDSWVRTMPFKMKAGKKYSISYAFKPLYNESSSIKISKKDDGSGLSEIYSSSYDGLPWKEHSVDFVADQDTLYYIYFGIKGHNGYGGFFDEVMVTTESPISMPDNLRSEFTNDSTVVLTWDETGDATKWEVKHGPKGFDPIIGGKHIKNLSNKSFVVSDLDPASAFDWYVRSISDGGIESYWAGAGHFTTKHPQTESIAFMYETFEDVEVPGLPSYWRQFAFTGKALWGSEEFIDDIIAKVSVFDEVSETWMVTKPLNIQNIDNPHLSYLFSSFGYERNSQEVMVSIDYNGVGNPKDFTWHSLSDSIYDYGSYNQKPLDLTPYKDARSLYIAWKLSANKGGINFWEVDNVSLSTLFTQTITVTDNKTGNPVDGAEVRDAFGNTITYSNANGLALVPLTYQNLSLVIKHQLYEDYKLDGVLIDKDGAFDVALKPRMKLNVEVVDKATGSALQGAVIEMGDEEITVDNEGIVTFYADAGKVLSALVTMDGYNGFLLDIYVDEDTTVKVEMTRPEMVLPENSFNVSTIWGDTILNVVLNNNGNGPVSWRLNNDFTGSVNAYSGIHDTSYIWSVATSKADAARSYLIKVPFSNTDSIVWFMPLESAYKSIEFDNHQNLYGITRFGREIVAINLNTGEDRVLVDGIVLGLRFDELVINRFNGDMFALGGDPLNVKDKRVYAITEDTAMAVKTLSEKDLGLFFTGQRPHVMGAVAGVGGVWKIEEDGSVPGRFPRRFNLGNLTTGWDAAANGVLVFSNQVGYSSTMANNKFGLLLLNSGNYTEIGSPPDSLEIVAVAASSRLNDWFLPQSSEGWIDAGSSDTLKVRIMNDIPQQDDFIVKGTIFTQPFAGVHEFTVNASLRGYTSLNSTQPVGFSLYPNPSDGLFKTTGLNGFVKVYSLLGVELKTVYSGSDGIIDLRNDPKGIYMVKDMDTGFIFRIINQ